MRQGALGWCTGMTLRDGMEREVGGRVRMGNTCTPMADSYECMAVLFVGPLRSSSTPLPGTLTPVAQVISLTQRALVDNECCA